MDILDLKRRLYENTDDIIKILEYYNYEKIKVTDKEIRCARDLEGNQSSIRIKLNENLNSTDFARNISGDIITLIMNHKNLTFVEVLNDIKHILGLKNIQKRKIILPFGGMFQNISKIKHEAQDEVQTYNDDILNDYEKCWNIRFAKDNILPKVQLEFNIGYDDVTNRISVPWRNINGEIVGVMGRINDDNISEQEYKWFPLIPFSKLNVLYGFSENYKYIMENDDIYIGESEKFVLQLASYGYRNCVCLGGNNLGEKHIKYILSTNPKRIILCYDEGLEIEVIKRAIHTIKPFLNMKECEVYIVYDKHNKYLKKDSKDAPSDLGKHIFEKIIQECLVKVI